MDIKQIIQHQDTLIALSASGRLYRLEMVGAEMTAVQLNLVIVPEELKRGTIAGFAGCSLLDDQAG